jgi:hypothetical protein
MRGGQTAARRRRQLGGVIAALVVVAGLLVAAAALGDPADPGHRPRFALPGQAVLLTIDALIGALFTGAIIVLPLLVWAAMTGPRAPVPRRPPWWRLPVRVALLAVLVLGLAWLLEPGWLGEMSMLVERLQGLVGDPHPQGDGTEGTAGAIDPAQRLSAVLAGALTMALAAAAALHWLLRDEGGQPSEPDEGEIRGGMQPAAVDTAFEGLGTDADPRRTVLRCYARLEAELAEVGCPRRVAETAREHQRRASQALGPATGAAARIVERFEHARYDDRQVGETERQEAVAALQRVREVLRVRAGEPAQQVEAHGRVAGGRR